MTVEHKAVGVMVIQEQDKFETLRILGEVVFYLTAQGRIALDAPACMNLFQENVAIGKVQDTI